MYKYTSICNIPVPVYYPLEGSMEVINEETPRVLSIENPCDDVYRLSEDKNGFDKNDQHQQPTVTASVSFSAADDAAALHTEMKGLGNNKQLIVDILTTRSNSQRQEIAEHFTQRYSRSLRKDLKSELKGNLKHLIIALISPPNEYLCKQLKKSLKAIPSINAHTLIEILCTTTNDKIQQLDITYGDMYTRPITEHVFSKTSGDFQSLLSLILPGVRDETGYTDVEKAREQAAALHGAIESKQGTDVSVINPIMVYESYVQLSLIFAAYKNLYGKTIEQAIRHNMSGFYKKALLAIVEWTQSPPAYYAKRLHKCMKGFTTDDNGLVRIVVSRSEIDLQNIKEEFRRLHDRTLLSDIKSKTSGTYQRALSCIVGCA